MECAPPSIRVPAACLTTAFIGVILSARYYHIHVELHSLITARGLYDASYVQLHGAFLLYRPAPGTLSLPSENRIRGGRGLRLTKLQHAIRGIKLIGGIFRLTTPSGSVSPIGFGYPSRTTKAVLGFGMMALSHNVGHLRSG